ncbi:MAG: amidohydrolase family protein [Gemmatimonadetes bacterium]|nr:amidohydrolase family protein [Gemmatimonadota bacterium]NIO32073.1 amidohydrolase family protein [Gemmatimonadota bacterium]
MTSERLLAVRAGKIRTLDPERPEVDSLAIRAGRILGLGSAEEIHSLVGGSGEWLDLRPATVVPGLTDSHIHLIEWALGRTVPDLSRSGAMDQVLASVRDQAESVPRETWLEFKGWDPALRPEAGLADLDAASQGRAVALVAHDLHSGWLNTEAMRRLGILENRSDPPGGAVERDADGRPTGLLKERALDWWYEGRPRPSDAERRAALLQAQAALHRLGVTAVHSVEAPESFRLLERLELGGELELRVLHHFPQRFIDTLIECGIASGFGSERLRVGGIKYFSDGALGSRTAWMLEPYEDSEGCGILRLEPQELAADVERALAAGLSATVHAIGDAAVRMVLDTLESAGSGGLAIPHRIEHLQCVQRGDLARAARSGIVASMQPSHLLTDIRLAEERWGPERCRGTMALRSLLRAGTVLAFGSDAPVEEPDPRECFYAALARRDRSGYPSDGWFPDERLTGLEVLRGYTEGPAVAAGDADRRGRLSPGHHADFCAWDIDPAAAAAEEIPSGKVLATVVGGEVVYRADAD